MMDNKIIEKLAELEHQQWVHLIKFFRNLTTKQLIEKIEIDYTPLLCDYKNLTEVNKEKDRIWARKVLEVCDVRDK